MAALPGFPALTGSDTTGHINGKHMSSCFIVFMKAGDDVIRVLTGLGVGVCCLDVKLFFVSCSRIMGFHQPRH